MIDTSRYRDVKELLIMDKILAKADIKCEQLGVWNLYPAITGCDLFKKAKFAVVGKHHKIKKYPILFWHEQEDQADYNAKVVRLLGGEAEVIPKKEAIEMLRKDAFLDTCIKSFLEGGKIVE